VSGKAGLYVHLPYCRVRCAYCTFAVSTDRSTEDRYLEAVRRERAIVSRQAQHIRFDSVYLGGGTPSALSLSGVSRILKDLSRSFELEEETEVTLEANPEDVTWSNRDAWMAAGVNRFSVGVQSLHDGELTAVGRTHDAARARQALQILAGGGLSVSADLLLGLPHQTPESFRRSLQDVIEAGVDHVSVYLLETDRARPIVSDRRQHPERYLSDDAEADLWLEAGETLASRGLVHYEISSWARPGRQARHNRKYWTLAPTLGLGVSAHEYWEGRRRANVSSLEQYIRHLETGLRPLAFDRLLDARQQAQERIVLGLRLVQGIPAASLEEWIARSGDPSLSEDYGRWHSEGLLSRSEDRVHFTERGFLLSNEVLCRFV
jgi:oxygen-independent coproporphyrinogen-3 oxidase